MLYPIELWVPEGGRNSSFRWRSASVNLSGFARSSARRRQARAEPAWCSWIARRSAGVSLPHCPTMEVIFLGSGTSQGVPMIACDCAVCRSPDPRDRRMRASIHVVMDGLHVQVDAPPPRTYSRKRSSKFTSRPTSSIRHAASAPGCSRSRRTRRAT